MQKCIDHEMRFFGNVELRIVEFEQENGKLVHSRQTGDVVGCSCHVCSVCGHVELTELTGQAHDEDHVARHCP
jgi:hypothetical protein